MRWIWRAVIDCNICMPRQSRPVASGRLGLGKTVFTRKRVKTNIFSRLTLLPDNTGYRIDIINLVLSQNIFLNGFLFIWYFKIKIEILKVMICYLLQLSSSHKGLVDINFILWIELSIKMLLFSRGVFTKNTVEWRTHKIG